MQNSPRPRPVTVTKLRFFQVDAFTSVPFTGNPAAVCLPEEPLEATLMQAVASEMNLSETAFVGPLDAEGERELRWFTPAAEVPLCGHATLASAHVLGTLWPNEFPVHFATASGVLEVERDEEGFLTMNFPSDPPAREDAPQGLLSALGLTTCHAFRARLLWVLEVQDESAVHQIDPDFHALKEVDLGGDVMGIAVTAPGAEFDFVSRFFAPRLGVDEDPVTGSAHAALAPFWISRLGRQPLSARQISQRPGELTMSTVGERVLLTGQAVTVAEGVIHLP